MSEGNEPAFPAGYYPTTGEVHPHSGLTKREWFAGMALQGILANTILTAAMGQATSDVNKVSEGFSKWAYDYADAMIEEGKKTK